MRKSSAVCSNAHVPLQACATQVVFLAGRSAACLPLACLLCLPHLPEPAAAPHRAMVTNLLFHTATTCKDPTTSGTRSDSFTLRAITYHYAHPPTLAAPNRSSYLLLDPEKRPKLYYSKFPPTMDPTWQIVLVDPMRKE
jgi:hypothetical protein